MQNRVTRRSTLAGMFAVAATPLAAADRAIIATRSPTGQSQLSCDNSQVPVSALRSRRATPADFSGSKSCALLRDSFEGPYFICQDAETGKDITGGLGGQSLTLALRVIGNDCQPLADAVVDVWACGADGRYSGHSPSPDVPVRGGSHRTPDTPERFCRGVLRTDRDGIAEWDTIYPGYYAGRAIHVHFKVHRDGYTYLTNQALMPEEWNLRVMQTPPYDAARPIKRVTEDRESGRGIPVFSVTERNGHLMATLNIALP